MEKEKSLGISRTHFSEEVDGRKHNVRLIISDGDVFEAAAKILKATLVGFARVNWRYIITETTRLAKVMPEGNKCYAITACPEETEFEHLAFTYFVIAGEENVKRICEVIRIMDADAKVTGGVK